MVKIGTPLSPTSTKVLLLGAGELGKEVAIELQRLGVEVIAVDRYSNAPAMQVAHRSHVLSMLNKDALEEIIEKEKPDLIVPEIEAIATDVYPINLKNRFLAKRKFPWLDDRKRPNIVNMGSLTIV